MTVPAGWGDPTIIPQIVAYDVTSSAPTGVVIDRDLLADSIMEITVETQIEGASILSLQLFDPDWKITRSGICDVDANGFLPPIDIEFPKGTGVWWRLGQANGSNDLSDANLTLSFQQRIITYLMDCWGPLTWPSGQIGNTRAQFVRMLVQKVQSELPADSIGPGSSPIQFVCPDLKEIQPVAGTSTSSTVVVDTTTASAQMNKTPGLTLASSVTVKGARPTALQIENINTILGVGRGLNAPMNALIASMYAAMGESSIGTDAGIYSPTAAAQGVFQTLPGDYDNGRDLTGQANGFFTGGTSFSNGGAIKLANAGYPPAQIANAVENNAVFEAGGGNSENPNSTADSYGREWTGGQAAGIAEATSIVQAYSGGTESVTASGSDNTSDVAQLTRGTVDNPDEDSWTCMQRLASEVNWSVFSSPSPAAGTWGNYLYYIDGPSLVAQQPSLYLSLSDDGTKWTATSPAGKAVDGAGNSITANLAWTVDNCLAIDTPIPTPDGWTTMGDLRPGDLVFGVDGDPVRIIDTSEVHEDRACYAVRFSDGSRIITDGGHLWETVSNRVVGDTLELVSHQRYRGVRSTETIRETLRDPGGAYMHRVRVADPLCLPDADLPIDPYVLGYWLGDGCASGTRIATAKQDVPNLLTQIRSANYGCQVREYLPAKSGFSSRPQTFVSVYLEERRALPHRESLTGRLRDLGVLDNKHIPQSYLRASQAQRLALLQGLMDSDGCMTRTCTLALADDALADGAAELIQSLGFRIGQTRKAPRGASRKWQTVITFAARDHCIPFRLPRKTQKYCDRISQRAHIATRYRSIIGVDPTETVPVKCIQVDAVDNLFLAGRNMIPTHNTAALYYQTKSLAGSLGKSRRKMVARKTRIRRPQTPQMIQIDLIAGVMEFNAGDVAVIRNAGPLNGRWIVEDVTHNVLKDLYAQLTLGPSTYPYPEPESTTASSSTTTASTSTSSSSGLTASEADQIDTGTLRGVAQAAQVALAQQDSSHVYEHREERPFPTNDLFSPAAGPRVMDCSQFATLCYKAAGLPDPNHNHYDQYGNTSTLITYCTQITEAQAEPGDLCFFGSGGTIARQGGGTITAAGGYQTTHVNVYVGNGQSISMGMQGDPSIGPSAEMGPSGFLGFFRSDVAPAATVVTSATRTAASTTASSSSSTSPFESVFTPIGGTSAGVFRSIFG